MARILRSAAAPVSWQGLSATSHWLGVSPSHAVHILQVKARENAPAVFMLHGAIENGQMFYSKSGRGLAPFLARQGFNVFVADLRGRGRSTPSLKEEAKAGGAKHGQLEYIRDDIPQMVDAVRQLAEQKKVHCVAHSWGGVLVASAMGRTPAVADAVASQVYIGTKRYISVFNWDRVTQVMLAWNVISPVLAAIYGYLPAKELKMGSDGESKQSLRDSITWVQAKQWKDTIDGFDYEKAVRQLSAEGRLPPTWHMTGKADRILGNPVDVRLFAESMGRAEHVSVLGKSTGYMHDYDHINILTHPDCEKDHFPQIADWLRKHHMQ